jgi:hypothetical protein
VIHCRDYRSIFPLTPKELRRLIVRIEESPDGCWLWTGAIGVGGYGRVLLRDTWWQTHRMIYELLVGPVPPGCVLHHRCRHKWCCNPAHLQAVPQAENLALDAAVSGPRPHKRPRTRCRNGHELTEANVRWHTIHGVRSRCCRICENAAARRRNEKRKLLRAAVAALSSSAGDAPQAQPEGGDGCSLSRLSHLPTFSPAAEGRVVRDQLELLPPSPGHDAPISGNSDTLASNNTQSLDPCPSCQEEPQ